MKANRPSKLRTSKGYSLYYVPCRCCCGCRHACGLMYGPYGKAYNAKGMLLLRERWESRFKR